MEGTQKIISDFFEKLNEKSSSLNGFFEVSAETDKIELWMFDNKLTKLGYNEESEEKAIIMKYFQDKKETRLINLTKIREEYNNFENRGGLPAPPQLKHEQNNIASQNQNAPSNNNFPLPNIRNRQLQPIQEEEEEENKKVDEPPNEEHKENIRNDQGINNLPPQGPQVPPLPIYSRDYSEVDYFKNQQVRKENNEMIEEAKITIMYNYRIILERLKPKAQTLLNVFSSKDTESRGYLNKEEFFSGIDAVFILSTQEIKIVELSAPNSCGNYYYKGFVQSILEQTEYEKENCINDYVLRYNKYINNLKKCIERDNINLENEWGKYPEWEMNINQFVPFVLKTLKNSISVEEACYTFYLIAKPKTTIGYLQFQKALENSFTRNKDILVVNLPKEEFVQIPKAKKKFKEVIQEAINDIANRPEKYEVKVKEYIEPKEIIKLDELNKPKVYQNSKNCCSLIKESKSIEKEFLLTDIEYTVHYLYCLIYDKLKLYGNYPGERFYLKDYSKNGYAGKADYEEILSRYQINLDDSQLSLLLNSLTDKTSTTYSYVEFFYNVNRVPYYHLTLKREAYSKTQLTYNKMVIGFKSFVKQNNIHVLNTLNFVNGEAISLENFIKFCKGISFFLTEEDYKELYEIFRVNQPQLTKKQFIFLLSYELSKNSNDDKYHKNELIGFQGNFSKYWECFKIINERFQEYGIKNFSEFLSDEEGENLLEIERIRLSEKFSSIKVYDSGELFECLYQEISKEDSSKIDVFKMKAIYDLFFPKVEDNKNPEPEANDESISDDDFKKYFSEVAKAIENRAMSIYDYFNQFDFKKKKALNINQYKAIIEKDLGVEDGKLHKSKEFKEKLFPEGFIQIEDLVKAVDNYRIKTVKKKEIQKKREATLVRKDHPHLFKMGTVIY